MSEYRWGLAGLPFMPEGRVIKGDQVLIRLIYEDQDEKLLVARLAAICRAMKSTDKRLNK